MMKIQSWHVKNCLIPLSLSLLLLVCSCTLDSAQRALFRDNFDDPDGEWGTEADKEFGRGYETGEYFIELKELNWFAWATPGQNFSDLSVEVKAYLSSGSQDNHFGILCRHADLENFYYFAISADGYYAIFQRVDGGGLEALTADGEGMIHSPAIRTGKQVNALRAVCQGKKLSFYVNGELLETVTDETHTRGDAGIGAGSGAEGEVRIQFDDFVVAEP